MFCSSVPEQLTLREKKNQITECLKKTGLNLSIFPVDTAPSKQSQDDSQKLGKTLFPGGGGTPYNGLYGEEAIRPKGVPFQGSAI